jgi:hypothetical protein
MKNLLSRLGLIRKQEPSSQGEPICNVSDKTNYFNRVASWFADFPRQHNRNPTSKEIKAFETQIQAELGVRVEYHPGYISFS